MKNYVQAGDNITITAAADLTSGDAVAAGLLVGIAQETVLSGDDVVIVTKGVFEVPKTSAQAWTVGQAIYLIPSTGNFTTATTAGNIFCGVAVEAAANPSDTGLVRLNGVAPAAAAS